MQIKMLRHAFINTQISKLYNIMTEINYLKEMLEEKY